MMTIGILAALSLKSGRQDGKGPIDSEVLHTEPDKGQVRVLYYLLSPLLSIVVREWSPLRGLDVGAIWLPFLTYLFRKPLLSLLSRSHSP